MTKRSGKKLMQLFNLTHQLKQIILRKSTSYQSTTNK